MAARLLGDIRRMFHALHARSASIEHALHVTSPQLWLLQELSRSTEPLSLGDVARKLAVHKANAGRLVERLVQKGLVTAGRSESDRRLVHVRLTKRGARIATRELPAPPQADLLARLRDLPARRLERYAKTTAELVKLMGAQDVEPALLFDDGSR